VNNELDRFVVGRYDLLCYPNICLEGQRKYKNIQRDRKLIVNSDVCTDLEGGGRGLLQCTIPVFAWINLLLIK
jgi:hypothetical protein